MFLDNPSKTSLSRLINYKYDIHFIYPDGCNVLHYLMKIDHNFDELGSDIFLNYLLDENVDTQLIDKKGNSPLFYALEFGHYDAAEKIKKKNGKLKTTTKRIF